MIDRSENSIENRSIFYENARKIGTREWKRAFFLIFFSAINQEMKSVGLEKEEGAEEILGSENFGIDGRFPMVGRRPHAGHHRVPS